MVLINLKCIRRVWPIVGEQFCQYIINFFETGVFNPIINTTWITLIPKKKESVRVEDFRPISLVRSIYKVIAKILSRRLITMVLT